MTELSHWPTDTPERRAASRAVSRAPGGIPFTCHGARLIRPPTFRLADKGRSRRSGPYPLTGRGGTPHGCPRSDFFRVTVNMRLRRAGAATLEAKLWPPRNVAVAPTSVLKTDVVPYGSSIAPIRVCFRGAERFESRPSSQLSR